MYSAKRPVVRDAIADPAAKARLGDAAHGDSTQGGPRRGDSQQGDAQQGDAKQGEPHGAPPTPRGISASRFWAFSLGMAVMAGMLFVLAWQSAILRDEVTRTQESSILSQRLADRIVHLDEVLTLAAQMASVTGEPQWGLWYDSLAVELYGVLAQALAIANASNAAQYVEVTSGANEKLVSIERNALVLVQQGKLREAQSLLQGKEYVTQKKIYT